MEAILVGIGDFRPACYIQDIIEDFRSDFRNGLLSRRNAASRDIDEVKPVVLHFIAAADFDDRSDGKAIRVPRPVMKTCSPMPLASWLGPQTMSLAGVAA